MWQIGSWKINVNFDYHEKWWCKLFMKIEHSFKVTFCWFMLQNEILTLKLWEISRNRNLILSKMKKIFFL